MIKKYIEYMKSKFGHVDAILITNKHGIIEYSAMFSYDTNHLISDDIIGKNLLDVYTNLDKETSSHFRVMRDKKPIMNERQSLIDIKGNKYDLINYTFPLEANNEIIGTIELSVYDNKKTEKSRSVNKLYTLDDIITQNDTMLKIKDKILRVSRTNSYVLITGNTGTGKELVAQAIHSHSSRNTKPFISVNCSAIPSSLLESTLFGTVKGSFTGAENKKGLFELANHGTLFLDEINSMDKDLQSKILKAIEDKEIRPVGSEKTLDIDVRIVSAMNIDPILAIKNNILRSDLYYRLCVVRIDLPSLNFRNDDISILTKHFIDKFNLQMNKNIVDVDELVSNVFLSYDWPGNVREFKNVIESAFNICSGEYITLNDIPEYIIYDNIDLSDSKDYAIKNKSLPKMLYDYEKQLISNAVSTSKSITEAANKLQITRQALRYKLQKFNFEPIPRRHG